MKHRNKRDDLDDLEWYKLTVQDSCECLELMCEVETARMAEPPDSMRITVRYSGDSNDFDSEHWHEMCSEVTTILHNLGIRAWESRHKSGLDPLDDKPYEEWVVSELPAKQQRNHGIV